MLGWATDVLLALKVDRQQVRKVMLRQPCSVGDGRAGQHGAGRAEDSGGQNALEVAAPVIFRVLGPLAALPEAAWADGAVFPELLPRAVTTVTQQIASGPGLVQTSKDGARDFVWHAIAVLSAFSHWGDGQFDQEIAGEASPKRRCQRSPIVSTRVNCPLLM